MPELERERSQTVVGRLNRGEEKSMGRAIDEDDVIHVLEQYTDTEQMQGWVRSLPSAQPERKTGKWIRKTDSICYWFECSECHKRPLCNEFTGQYELSAHCPNCGASMMEGEQP